MTPSAACTSLARFYESCDLTAYPDPGTGGDPWTCGWGSTGPDIHPVTVWTQAQADQRFDQDIGRFAAAVNHLIGSAPTSQHEFDALVSFAYNAGATNLASSTLLKKHLAGDKAGAAAEFGRWIHSGGKVLGGLITRRAAEAALYMKS
jgi:lysozyme